MPGMLYNNGYSGLSYFYIDCVKAFFALLYIEFYLVVFANGVNEASGVYKNVVSVITL